MKRIQILITAILLVTAFACRKDDGLPDIEEVPQRLLSEVAVEDDAAIKSYLETHFYNYEEFENPSLDFDFEVRFDTIAGDNADKIALITQVQTVVVNQASSDFGRVDDEEIDHNLYYLEVRQGSGESPTVGDRVILQYEGTLLNGTKFDGRSTPLNQYLSGGLVRGYASGVEKLKGGEGPIENGDGTRLWFLKLTFLILKLILILMEMEFHQYWKM